MPLFAVICRDKPGALQTRLDTRDAHLAHIRDSGIVAMAGPLIEDGEMAGSLVILDAADLAAAQAWAAADPYKAAGLFATTQITEWKKVIG
ncbi:YciI family protein [Paracoccus liaowanqingii]|uniref:YciI family protein n=1 Tax=Paracoccus liaowanqingii TaxID=2560053 RepID=A0A4P7HP02_9RHOB|nr:YciI family protein [Paracoccus liaowanqingii]QBX36026.1 YciI family protein [Paracoccus liaowanqingii]TGN43609.1 YciI family protein [Paracoccus liaowanqingii]